jgi:hypothetical protein
MITNLLNLIPYLKWTSSRKEEKKHKDAYDLGFKAGHEQGIHDGMNFMISHSRDLTEEEFKELIKFLTERNMVLTYCQNQYHNGLAVRVDVTKDTRAYS